MTKMNNILSSINEIMTRDIIDLRLEVLPYTDKSVLRTKYKNKVCQIKHECSILFGDRIVAIIVNDIFIEPAKSYIILSDGFGCYRNIRDTHAKCMYVNETINLMLEGNLKKTPANGIFKIITVDSTIIDLVMGKVIDEIYIHMFGSTLKIQDIVAHPGKGMYNTKIDSTIRGIKYHGIAINSGSVVNFLNANNKNKLKLK